MGSKNVLMIVAFVALAALVGLTVRSMLSDNAPVQANETKREVVRKEDPKVWIARDTLEVGTFVDPGDLEAVDWPRAVRQPNYLLTSEYRAEDLAGAVVRERLVQGDPVTLARVVKPGERGFLAAVLLPGMRAVTIGIDNVTGNAGLVLPGDRIDLILTQKIENIETGEEVAASETIATAVRVLAIGTRLSTATNSDDVDERVKSVTLEATPKQAEKIAVSDALGSLSLSLRSLPSTENDAIEEELATTAADLSKPSGATFAYEVSKALEKGSRNSVQVMRGGVVRTSESN